MTAKPLGNRIHVAGVHDEAEARLLIDSGVRSIGLPLVLGYHAEDLDQSAAAGLVERLGDRAEFFLITYLAEADEIDALCRRLGVGMVQLHGKLGVPAVERLRERRPDLRIIKSLIVRAHNIADLAMELDRFAPLVDAFITDTYDPETGASGATGKVHDWDVSARMVDLSPRPVLLAGGLNPWNVAQAIRTVRPAGVDVHTGVEGPNGRKDQSLVQRFLAAARAAFAG